MRKKRGAILFVAVGAIAVLSILAIGTTSSVMQELRLAKFIYDSETSFYLAISAAETMKTLLAQDETPGAVTLYDLRDRQIPFGDRAAWISIFDEEGFINIRFAGREVLSRLPGLAGDGAFVDAILAKRAAPYSEFGDVLPAAAGLTVKEEILLFDEASRETYDQFKDLITVFGNGAVNINTAGQEVLFALGMDEDLIAKIQEFRQGEDGISGTEDDGFFGSLSEIVPGLSAYGYGLSSQQATLLNSLMSSAALTCFSRYIRFDMSLKKGTKKVAWYQVVVNLQDGTIISWGEG